MATRIAKYFNGNRKILWRVLEAIHIAQKQQKVREIKQAVEKDLRYLFSSPIKPVSIIKDIDCNALEKFIELT